MLRVVHALLGFWKSRIKIREEIKQYMPNFLMSDKLFDVKERYQALQQTRPNVPWSKIIWSSNLRPRTCFIAWLGIKKALRTKAKLMAWKYSN